MLKALISDIVPDSIAEELNLQKGDFVISIDGQALEDLIDYRFLTAGEEFELEIEKANGEMWLFDIEKDEDESLGIIFEHNVFDGMKTCCNNCVFCFMQQLPADCRSTLSVKDDDYRLSFLQGNFITGTNLKPQEIQRIKNMGISPLYFSVHTTNGQLRKQMLNNKNADQVMQILQDLTAHGIAIHGQIVLCPELNDQAELDRTVGDLATLYPMLQSLAVVPVGLTKYHKNNLRVYTKDEAAEVLVQVAQWQKQFMQEQGGNFFFAADEFYILAAQPLPDNEHYQEYPQLENGVGLCRLFLTQWETAQQNMNNAKLKYPKLAIVTGVSAKTVLEPIVAQLNAYPGLEVELLAITNCYFGNTVTVAGLLTGQCLIAGLRAWRNKWQDQEQPILLIPASMLKYGEDVFLDDLTVTQVEESLAVTVKIVEVSGFALFDAIFEQ